MDSQTNSPQSAMPLNQVLPNQVQVPLQNQAQTPFANQPPVINPKSQKKKHRIKFILQLVIIAVLFMAIGWGYNLGFLDFIWNPYFAAVFNVVFFPFYILPKDFFVLSGGFVAVSNPLTISLVVLVTSFIWLAVWKGIVFLCKKMVTRGAGALAALFVMIAGVLVGFFGGAHMTNACLADFEGREYEPGIIELHSARMGGVGEGLKVFDPVLSTKGKIFSFMHGIPVQDGGFTMATDVQYANSMAYVRVAAGTEKDVACSINTLESVYAFPTKASVFYVENKAAVAENKAVAIDGKHLSFKYEAGKIYRPMDMTDVYPRNITGITSFEKYSIPACGIKEDKTCSTGIGAADIEVIQYDRPVNEADLEANEAAMKPSSMYIEKSRSEQKIGNYTYAIKEESDPEFHPEENMVFYQTAQDNTILQIWLHRPIDLSRAEIEKVIASIVLK